MCRIEGFPDLLYDHVFSHGNNYTATYAKYIGRVEIFLPKEDLYTVKNGNFNAEARSVYAETDI